MRYRIFFCLVSFFLILSACDVLKPDSSNSKILELRSDISDDVTAKDVVQVEERIFIFGEATVTGEKDQVDFYLAEINAEGELQWEKRYGTHNDEMAAAVMATSDDHLLLVGGTQPNRRMYVVKIDYSGNTAWQKSYDFDPDNVGFGGNNGESVTEVNGGYIIGGSGSASEGNQGIGVPALTKITPDGTKIWSKAATQSFAGGGFYGLQSYKDGSQFLATGLLNDADFIVYDAQTADTVRIVDQFHSGTLYLGLAKAGNTFISSDAGSNRLELLGLSDVTGDTYRYVDDQYERYSAINIDSFSNTVIITGETADYEFKNRNIFALKSDARLSARWTFYHISDKMQRAVGAYVLSNGETGIVGNEIEGNRSHIILLKVSEQGELSSF